MQRAFDLAVLGKGDVSPNPLVGCVIVHNDQIIGEGYHQKYGEAHAEVNAVNTVKDKSLLKEADVYVTLEPCSHFGKTPPCADLLAKHQVKRVIIANLDPNPLVSGNGVSRMEADGIIVSSGHMEEIGEQVNKRYFTFMREKRPYIILKWAETKDGFIARKDFSSKWISNANSRQLVHKWRAEEDAIMVGKNTAKHDDPSLNVREWTGHDPIRLVIDRQLTLPNSLKLFSDGQPTICFNSLKNETNDAVEFVKLKEEGIIEQIIAYLHQVRVQSVIIEGGSQLLQGFIDSGFWDEARIFTGQSIFEDGIAAPLLKGQLEDQINVQGDTLVIKRNQN